MPRGGQAPDAVAEELPSTNLLHLAISLPLRNRDALTNLLQRIYDPASADYHYYLTAGQFAEQFGHDAGGLSVRFQFRRRQRPLKVHPGTHPNRTMLDVVGEVADVERTFHVTLHKYQHPKEPRTFFAPDQEPSLDLAVPVLKVAGLDTFVVPRPAIKMRPASAAKNPNQLTGSGPSGNYMGNDFRSAYVPGVNLTGTGQIVGLFECDGYYTSDITSYESQAGLTNVPLINVPIDGGVSTIGDGVVEVSLDIEMAIAMAPGLSSVMVYEAPTDPVNDGSPPYLYDMLNRIATDNLAKQISSSWVFRSDPSIEQAFMQFATQGQSFFEACGDEDAYTTSTFQWDDDPYIIIGGRDHADDGTRAGRGYRKTVWNWGVEFGSQDDGEGTGGGISANYLGNVPIPSWQQGINMTTNGGSTTMRNIPDVALTADKYLRHRGQWSLTYTGVGRHESCAAPLWAAFIALVNQQALANGGTTAGFINPAIYAIGKGAGYTSAFHDITTGNNTWSGSPSAYYAVPGYDLCTGWGTPAGVGLINVLAPTDVLRITPATGFASAGGVGGPFTATSETLTLTNAGTNSLSWSLTNNATWLNITGSGGTLTPGGPASTVTVSLNAAASNLMVGTYNSTVWFTNLTDGVGQSRVFALNVVASPTITNSPGSQAVLQGATVLFSVGAAGAVPLSFRWQLNGTNLTDGGNISGSATAALTISNVAPANLGAYDVIVSNPGGAVTSSPPANLTITPSKPVITAQPASQFAIVGASVQFNVAALGNAPFSYQWYFDNATVANATNATLNAVRRHNRPIGRLLCCYFQFPGRDGEFQRGPDRSASRRWCRTAGFELGSFTDWTSSGNFRFCTVASFAPYVHSGTYGAQLGPLGALGFLSQNVPTVAGGTYLISCWFYCDGQTPNEFSVSWNGVTLSDQINMSFIGWTNLQFQAGATSSGTALKFGFRDDPGYLGLDDIAVYTLNAVPTITAQPTNEFVVIGANAAFNLAVSGSTPLYYSWSQNGAPIAGATNSSYTTNNVPLAASGSEFSCLVSNAYGAANSSNALLTVSLPTVDHFTWSPVGSPQGVNVPFPVTLEAQDSLGRAVSDFAGAVTLSAQTGGMTTNAILGSPTYQATAGGTWTLGYAFTPNVNITVTQVITYFGTKVSIWTIGGTLLASLLVLSNPSNWVSTPLTPPLTLTAGSEYVVAAYTGGGSYYWRADLTNTFPNGVINQSYNTSGDAFPTTADGAKWWLVSLGYTAGAPVPVAITPTNAGPFVNGFWSGDLTALQDGTNVTLIANDGAGHSGLSNPFNVVPTLGITQTSGGFQVSIAGSPGEVYNVMASTNLITWQTIATVTNVTGMIQFMDPISTNFNQRFYLEVMP